MVTWPMTSRDPVWCPLSQKRLGIEAWRWRYYRPTRPHLEGPSRQKSTYLTRLAGLATKAWILLMWDRSIVFSEVLQLVPLLYTHDTFALCYVMWWLQSNRQTDHVMQYKSSKTPLLSIQSPLRITCKQTQKKQHETGSSVVRYLKPERR